MKTFGIKRAASEVHMKASITTLLLRDGTVYFVTLFLFNLTEVVLARYTQSVGYITPLIQIATSILISRFMLNLRALSRSRNENETMPSLPRFSNLQIASQIAGNMGAQLEHGQEVGPEPGLILEDEGAVD
ncbi:hypothetical protein A0H81_07277 [Grifola frondosa]|uniref:Uncharacterized protein n=1 Tax=Grifola frondosa TaxID=5627 RepID=A0A1C7M964_GRIFR|nr:hypothetical protein A0H81_07277 [Grifola frondosa]